MQDQELQSSTLEAFNPCITSLTVKHGDVVVFMTDKFLSVDQRNLVHSALTAVLPAGVKSMILDCGSKLAVLQQA